MWSWTCPASPAPVPPSSRRAPVWPGQCVTPGSIGAIDVRGAQRWLAPVPAAGAATVDLELPAGVYQATTRQITVHWGPAAEPPAP